MDCPRCGGEVERFVLDGRRAKVCASCGYVGVSADHRGETPARESWPEAIRRFRDAHRREREEMEDGDRVPIEVNGATYRVAVGDAERFEALTDKQRAIVEELLQEPDATDPERSRSSIGDAAGAHPSYVGEVLRTYEDLLAAIEETVPEAGDP